MAILPIGGALAPNPSRNDQNTREQTSAAESENSTGSAQQSQSSSAASSSANETQSTSQTQETRPVAPVEASSGTEATKPSRANSESVVVAQLTPQAGENVSDIEKSDAENLAQARAAAEAYRDTASASLMLQQITAPIDAPTLVAEEQADLAANPYEGGDASSQSDVAAPDAKAA